MNTEVWVTPADCGTVRVRARLGALVVARGAFVVVGAAGADGAGGAGIAEGAVDGEVGCFGVVLDGGAGVGATGPAVGVAEARTASTRGSSADHVASTVTSGPVNHACFVAPVRLR